MSANALPNMSKYASSVIRKGMVRNVPDAETRKILLSKCQNASLGSF